MKRKIFAVVGYTAWGKSNTLYELFGKRQFFPLKSPISAEQFGDKKFTVVNASNEDKPTNEYLKRLKVVLEEQSRSDIIFVITISLIFDGGICDVKKVFDYLNSLTNYEIHYIILEKGWNGESLKAEHLQKLEGKISKENSKIHSFDTLINKSKRQFKERTDEIALLF